MTVRNLGRYLRAVIDEYERECAEGFSDEYAAKQSLWRHAVVVFEIADDPDDYVNELRELALDVLKVRRIEQTIQSARRRASHV